MVEPRQAGELPELSTEADRTPLGEIAELTLGDTDTEAMRMLFMWKSVAAENVQQADGSPEPPDAFADPSLAELRETPLSAASTKEDKLRLLEYYVAEDVL